MSEHKCTRIRGAQVRNLFGCLAVAIFAGCQTVTPLPVRDLKASAKGDHLVITWDNPVNYEAVDLKVTDPIGKRLDAKKVYGFATQRGPAKAVVLNVEPGAYKISIDAAVKLAVGDTRRSSDEITCLVEGRGGSISSGEAPQLGVREPLDIVFLIHPGCSFGGEANEKKPLTETFRQVAVGVLSEAYRTAVRLPTEDDALRIEDLRDGVSSGTDRASWPIDPDALFVVDARASSPGVPAQLSIRVLDLKLSGALEMGPGVLSRELFNRRPLVVEQFRLIGDAEGLSDPRKAPWILRDAWIALLDDVRRHARYRYYLAQLAAFKQNPTPAAIPDLDALQAFMFNRLPKSVQPVDAEQKDAEKALGQFKQRCEKIERELLFGPADGEPKRAPRTGRKKAAKQPVKSGNTPGGKEAKG